MEIGQEMERQLLILRHGKSDWTTEAADDFSRPLAKRGRRASRRIGEWMRHNDVLPDHVLSSPALRAQQTTLRVCRELDMEGATVVWDQRIYLADTEDLCEVLSECPDSAERVLLVGHNPGLEDLLRWLTGDEVPPGDTGKLLPTAAVALLRLSVPLSGLRQGSASLIELVCPRPLES